MRDLTEGNFAQNVSLLTTYKGNLRLVELPFGNV